MSPQRIQLRRSKGWRKPEAAVTVARPTMFGNPFRVGGEHLIWRGSWQRVDVSDRAAAVELFRKWITTDGVVVDSLGWYSREHHRVLTLLPTLRGRDLACWCPLDQPCHADVLLEMANPGFGEDSNQ